MKFKLIKKYCLAKQPYHRATGQLFSQSGSVLLWLIFMILLIGGFGIGLLSFSNTANIAKLNAYFKEQAYYLAESGGRYAVELVKEDLDNGNTLNTTAIQNRAGRPYLLTPSGQFNLEIDNDDPDAVLIHSTGTANPGTNVECRVQLTYEVSNSDSSLFKHALFADSSLSMSNHSSIDSYDSSKGSYNETKDETGGAVGTNNSIADMSNNGVNIGDVTYKTDVSDSTDNVFLNQNRTLETIAQLECDCTGAIELGNFEIQHDGSQTLPREDESGNYEANFVNVLHRAVLKINGGIVFSSDTYFNFEHCSVEINGDTDLCAGTNFTISVGQAKLKINGNVVFIINGDLTISNDSEVTLSSDSTLTIYVAGNITIGNQASINEGGTPGNVMIYATGSSSTVTLQNGTQIYAAVYAPLSSVIMGNQTELYGGLVGNIVTMSNGAKIHYDGALGSSSGSSSRKTRQYYTDN